MVFEMTRLTLPTALRTPLPLYRDASPSRSSSASRSPVDAPEGTAARPDAPDSSATSTSTVGLPRESRISRACTLVIFTSVLLLTLFAAAPIRVRFEPERVFAEGTDERFVICRHDDDALIGDDVAPAIFFEVVADEGSAWNQHVTIDDRVTDSRVPSHADAGHQDAFLDVREAVHADVGAEHAAVDAAARDDATGRNHRVERLSAAAAGFREDELRRRRLRLVRPKRPLRIVQVEFGIHLTQVHVGLEVRIERADVAPVLRRFLVLVVEAIRVHRGAMNQRRNDVLAEIMRRRFAGVRLELAHEHVGIEDIDAHRCQREVGRSRDRRGTGGLLGKAGDPLLFVDGYDTESRRVGDRHLNRREGDGRAAFLM